MNIHHHPSFETLVAHAAGTLDPVLMPVVSLHLAQCERCRQHQHQAAQIGAALFAQHSGDDMGPFDLEHSLVTVKHRIEQPPPTPTNTPGFLERFSQQGLQQVTWRRVTSKIEMFEIPELSGSSHRLRLFRFQPGAHVPHHRHKGEEFSLVLQGAYIESDSCFTVGDFSEADIATRHAQHIESATPCIALIATTGQIMFDSAATRLTMRLLGLV
jgi:putative transcriptional regulator